MEISPAAHHTQHAMHALLLHPMVLQLALVFSLLQLPVIMMHKLMQHLHSSTSRPEGLRH